MKGSRVACNLLAQNRAIGLISPPALLLTVTAALVKAGQRKNSLYLSRPHVSYLRLPGTHLPEPVAGSCGPIGGRPYEIFVMIR
jgi:hypothetical protein